MNGITHKQAIQWIYRRLDGLLNESQLLSLDEHLRSCESCRAHAAEMDGLAAHAQNEFRRRWDDGSMPSLNVMKHVTTKAKRITMTNRISSGVKLFAGATALILLAVAINFVISQLQSTSPITNATETVDNTPPPENRLLAFTSNQNGNVDIYTMHADGSGLTNLTNDPANDGYPFWSPDGKQIAFMSNRDGSPQIYLMEADGSNMIQLTQGEGKYHLDVNGYTPWSPDGRKLIYSYRPPEETRWNLYVMDITEKTSTMLTSEPGEYILPSWSPDGGHVAFTTVSDRATNAWDLFVIGSDGSNLVSLTENILAGEIFFFGDYSWSQDETSITFSTHRYGQVGQSSAYQASLDGSLTVLARTDRFMVDWWNGTTLRRDSEAKTLTWLRSDSSQSTLNLCQSDDSIQGIAYKRSNDGNLVFGSNCSDRGWILYWANSDGTSVDELLSSPIPTDGNTDHISNMTWSPDDHYLAFVALHMDSNSDGSTTLYVLDIAKARNDPSIQPLKMTNSFGASWQPVHTPRPADNSPELKIDPQSCKPASELNSDLQPPSELYGYDLVQGTSFADGDFSYEFWLYCDPLLRPDDNEHFSSVAGLGLYASWHYNGPQVEGTSQDYFGFEPINKAKAFTKWIGPLYKASESGTFSMPAADTIFEHLQAKTPLQFSILMDSPLGQNGATFSFHLEPTEHGIRVIDLQASQPQNTRKGLLAFTSDQNGNSDIYTMQPDGSGLINLTNAPSSDHSPVWSPDGSRLAFVSDRDGNENIYVMNSNGSNLTRLTDDPGSDTSPLWSPDGKRIAYTLHEPDKKTANLYVMDSNGENHRRLTDRHPDPASVWVWAEGWSLDGEHIFYIDQQGIVKVHTVSGEPTTLTSQIDSPSYFAIRKEDSKIIYIHSCSAGEFCSTSKTIGENGTGEETHATMQLQRVCMSNGAPPNEINDYYYTAKWSPDRTKIMFAFNCFEYGAQFYIANSDGSDFRMLMNVPVSGDHLAFDWSPDGQSIIFASALKASQSESLYVLNIEKALENPDISPARIGNPIGQISSFAWQPVVNNEVVEEQPTPEPTQVPVTENFPPIGTGISNGEWIAFIGGEAVPDPIPVNLDVYMIHPDGSGLVNLTQSPAYYYYLQWSPDGQHLIFIRNTTDNKTEIMMHHVDETSPEILASTVFNPVEYTPNTYFKYSWSPDSKQIAFLDKRAGNYDIYTIDADESNEPELRQLTNDPGQEIDFAWSPDGSQIAYQRIIGEQLSIMVMNGDGSNQHEVARGMGRVSLRWSTDGTSLYAASVYLWADVKNSHLECEACVVKPAIYRIDMNEQSVQQIYYIEDSSEAEGWHLYDTLQNTFYFMRVKPQSYVGVWGTWFRADGNSVEELGELDPHQTCKTPTGNILNEHFSPNNRFSIISDFCAGGFDLYLADREAPNPQQRIAHLLRLPLNTWGQGGDNATLPMLWSPDGRWLVYDDGNQSVYLLDIEQTLRDPTTEPSLLYQSDSNLFMFSELVWQPKP